MVQKIFFFVNGMNCVLIQNLSSKRVEDIARYAFIACKFSIASRNHSKLSTAQFAQFEILYRYYFTFFWDEKGIQQWAIIFFWAKNLDMAHSKVFDWQKRRFLRSVLGLGRSLDSNKRLRLWSSVAKGIDELLNSFMLVVLISLDLML